MLLLITPDTTTLSYWLNWRVFLCAVWVLTPLVVAVFIIWKYDGLDHLRSSEGKTQPEAPHTLDGDETWRPCLMQIHPIWLLIYRTVSFCLLLATIIFRVSVTGFGIFYFYTQWTFNLLAIYFGFGALLSLHGCYQYHKIGYTPADLHHIGRDAEQGHYVPLTGEKPANVLEARGPSSLQNEIHAIQAARITSYLFQIMFQVVSGAVMLTDCVYWLIIFPYFTIKDRALHFMTINMHALNAALLLGDTALNCLQFPWFRIAYFILWTGIFVIFQWILRMFMKIWWPYPFLDLASPYAPLWYLLMASLHLPCYGTFVLIVKLKHYLLSKWFPQSYQCSR